MAAFVFEASWPQGHAAEAEPRSIRPHTGKQGPSAASSQQVRTLAKRPMEPKYPAGAYRGFRAALPDWFIGVPTAADQERAAGRLQLRPGDCVCDAACGSGFNLHRLVRAVGTDGLVIAVEDNANLLARSEAKVRRAGWRNVRLLSAIDADQLEGKPVDAILVSYNPPIFLQRQDLLGAAWQLLKPGGRLALVAGRCTTPVGRTVGPAVRMFLRLAGHGDDWHYWLVHEPWEYLGELSAGRLQVEVRWGFQYLLWAEKGNGTDLELSNEP